jgi:cytochrome c-type biogenesis protein CcmH/NrfG
MSGTPFRQRGWIGLVGLLIALVIVAVLAQTVLKSYGLIGGGERTAARGSSPPQPVAGDATQPAPANPIERARGLEREMKRDAQDLDRRMDEQTK